MKQQIKIIGSATLAGLESQVNDFLSEWEIRGIQVLTNENAIPCNERYIAIIKYQVPSTGWE